VVGCFEQSYELLGCVKCVDFSGLVDLLASQEGHCSMELGTLSVTDVNMEVTCTSFNTTLCMLLIKLHLSLGLLVLF
jgi:hypothetical protein